MEAKPAKQDRGADLPGAQALELTGLVSYQEGSVVSRTILRRETGTVTLFAFDEAQGVSEHTAPFDALAHVLEGEAEISIEGRPLRAAAGDVVLMPAHRPHALRAVTRFKMLLTMIRSRAGEP